MLSKEDLIKKLRANPLYRDALKMARNDAERRRIIAVTEGFLTEFVTNINPVFGHAQTNPKFATKLQEALKSGAQVVKESDGTPIASGSKG